MERILDKPNQNKVNYSWVIVLIGNLIVLFLLSAFYVDVKYRGGRINFFQAINLMTFLMAFCNILLAILSFVSVKKYYKSFITALFICIIIWIINLAITLFSKNMLDFFF
ncbi:hypothetical protein ACE193_24805 [Bernardetia sp. OM2101]|uniref:hypothetical protein n=1 Tax=Bernardetia sp. OM2101 TaxID=3344876 RepID=UPI0035CFD343